VEVNIHEAKTNLSKLIERARSGENVVIAKAGTPMVRLVPVDRPAKRVFGSAKGLITFRKGWDKPMTKREFDEFIGGDP
jgi:prevent-host-death family protein